MARKKQPPSAMERERKFLLRRLPAHLARYPHALIEQGYLAIAEGNKDSTEVRIRRSGKRAVLTIKRGSGGSRLEKEVSLPPRLDRALWPLTQERRIYKTRYKIPYHGRTIEVDVYRGHARGLAVAEVEFPSETASARFVPPDWFGREVTGNKKFANSSLAVARPKRGGRLRR